VDVTGPGVIQHFWITVTDRTDKGYFVLRDLVLRMYWDDEETPSVEVPLGDFFCNGFGARCNVNSLPIVVNPTGGMNCYFPMPFRKAAKCRSWGIRTIRKPTLRAATSSGKTACPCMGCTVGISWIQFDLKTSCGLRFNRWAITAASYLKERTTFLPWRIGTRPSRMHRFPPCCLLRDDGRDKSSSLKKQTCPRGRSQPVEKLSTGYIHFQ
jgi:hypothetical protein